MSTRQKIIMCILAMFICSGLLAQQQKPVVAIVPFDIISGAVTDAEADMITDVFSLHLGNTKKVNIVDRRMQDIIMKEPKFQSDDWSDNDKIAKLGEALKADLIVHGRIEKFGNKIMIMVGIYNIHTFMLEGAERLMLANAEEVYDKIDLLVDSSIKIITGATESKKEK